MIISILSYNRTRSILYMRSGYQPPYDKKYFHTKPKIKKRDMAAVKKKIQLTQRKNKMYRYEERVIRG